MAKASPAGKISFAQSYRNLCRTLVRLYRRAPQTLYFLIASAVFREGVGGFFTFGGILAAGSFGFNTTDVILFAVAGNIVAGLGALAGGKLDDAIGPKYVIVLSLAGVLCTAIPLLFIHTFAAFWAFALPLCAFVGPAQSASRTYLARLTPPGQEGEIFGLYSTTGRGASFVVPSLFSLFVTLFGGQIWGVLSMITVTAVGLLLMLPLNRTPTRVQL